MPGRREKAKTPDRFQQSRWMDLVQQREFETPPKKPLSGTKKAWRPCSQA